MISVPHHHQLCSAAPFPCSKAHCWGIKKFNIKIPVCCLQNITCMITSAIRGEQRPSPALFIPAKSRQGCQLRPSCVGRAQMLSVKWSFCYESFTDKIRGGNKSLDVATGVKMWPGIIGGSYRKRWSSSEGALCTHLGKGASKGLEIKDGMGDKADYCMNKIIHSVYCCLWNPSLGFRVEEKGFLKLFPALVHFTLPIPEKERER